MRVDRGEDRRAGLRHPSAFNTTRGARAPSRAPSGALPAVRMRAKKRHGDGGGGGRRPTTATAAEGPSTRLLAVQSVKEGRAKKGGDEHGDRVSGGGGGGGKEEEEEGGRPPGVPVTAIVDPMMPGRVSPPPRRPGAKWPGFLVNRSVTT